jgi:hypothetical protein
MDADVGMSELDLIYMKGSKGHSGFPEVLVRVRVRQGLGLELGLGIGIDTKIALNH